MNSSDALGDQVGARHVGGAGHRAWERDAAFERPAGEAAAEARDLQEPARAQPVDPVVDVGALVGAEQDRDVVRLEHGGVGVALEPVRVEQRGLAGPAVERKALRSLAGNEAVEVRKPPRDRHAEPGGRRGVVGVELREDVLERPLRVGEVGRGEVELGRHHLVMERRHEHLDVVLVHDLDPLEEMLLGQLRAGRDRPLRRRGRELVDELVDARQPERPDCCARDQLPPGRAHVEWDGAISTSPASSCLRYAMTFL